jgi:hypothetical protein
MDAITYRYVIAFGPIHKLMMHLMDVVTAHLYGILVMEIYIWCKNKLLRMDL